VCKVCVGCGRTHLYLYLRELEFGEGADGAMGDWDGDGITGKTNSVAKVT
jgi:hypothetical protein